MKLSGESVMKLTGIELKQLCIWDYKQFCTDITSDYKPFVFSLSELLTTVVGPNGLGKTTILQALGVFCTAIKHGSKCYSVQEAKDLFGIDYDYFTHLLQGVFDVHHDDQKNIKCLRLNVALIYDKPHTVECEEGHVHSTHIATHKGYYVHVYVTIGQEELSRSQYNELKSLCPSQKTGSLLYSSDYATFANLFPQVISFNRKSIINGNFRDLLKKYQPEIGDNISVIKMIDNEMKKVLAPVNFQFWKKSDGLLEIRTTRPPEFVLSDRGHYGEPITDITVCGEGVLQCFSLIITVCFAKANSIITIDEPDAHIFPNAQKKLVEFFYRKMKEFRESSSPCKMVITTHSSDIMQAVKLEDIRQIFGRRGEFKPAKIKSLTDAGQLLNAMTDLGTSILNHSEFVRLGVHRKLLYLENQDDYYFLRGIINRMAPELLHLPFTRMAKRGRTTPRQIQELILQFRQLWPTDVTLHIFILVDADLRRKSILEKEEQDYIEIQNKPDLNVKIDYHCWAAREWENWLLSNENLFYEMLCDDKMYYEDEMIKKLRHRIQQCSSTDSIIHIPDPSDHDHLVQTTTSSESSIQQLPMDKSLFEKWLQKELERHFDELLSKLTKSNMEGVENTSGQDKKKLQKEECSIFLRDNEINEDIMNKFGDLRKRIEEFIGYQLLQENEGHKHKGDRKRQKKDNANDNRSEAETCEEWLKIRKLQYPINLQSLSARKELTKWIDAKLFFHQLTHGEKSEPKNIDLDDYWKQAFAIGNLEDRLYKRYFSSLDPQNLNEWPEDFNILLRKFEDFIKAP